MNPNSSPTRDRKFIWASLGVALLVGIFISPFASQNPDGLDRVSQDLKFDDKAAAEPPAQKLPFYLVFEEYALRGVPEAIATPVAGLVGTLATFGVSLGVGRLILQSSKQNSLDRAENSQE
jgi:cobalt/nickel transport protein